MVSHILICKEEMQNKGFCLNQLKLEYEIVKCDHLTDQHHSTTQ